MIGKLAAAALIFVGALTVVVVGVGFAGFAIYQAFLPMTGPAGAAGLTALILLIVPVLACVAITQMLKKLWPANLRAAAMNPSVDNIALSFLAGLAKDRPIVAVLLAAVFGAATAVLRKKK